MEKKAKYGTNFSADDKDLRLSREAGEYLKALNDLNEIRNDPVYTSAGEIAVSMIADRGTRSGNSKKFVEESLSEYFQNKATGDMDEIRKEIQESGADLTASGWVEEWDERKRAGIPESRAERERREFVAGALNNEETGTGRLPKHLPPRRAVIRYAVLAAAMFAGAVFVIRSLIMPVDPGALFGRYYSPFAVVSAVTRSPGSDSGGDFTRAVAYYREGNYPEAASLFSKTIMNEPASGPSGFYLGLTELALGHPVEAATLLEKAAGIPGEYSGDAKWYLGLAYLMAGEREKASDVFRILARTGGFYSDRSAKILRRLR